MPNSIFSIYKPVGISSFKVLSDVKKFFNTKKVGHMGTLDPLAEGILPVAVGKYTKLISQINLSPKVYFVSVFVGLNSETLDSEGVDLSNLPKIDCNLSLKEVATVLDGMLGSIDQVPPLYSALKVNGKRLYEYARSEGDNLPEIKSRKVDFFNYSDLNIDGQIIKFRLSVGNGFYVRSLVRDLASELGVDAFMLSLVREAVGPFNLQNVTEIDQIESLDLDTVLPDCLLYELDDQQFKNIENGNPLMVEDCDFLPQSKLILKYNSQPVAFAEYDEGKISIIRLFI